MPPNSNSRRSNRNSTDPERPHATIREAVPSDAEAIRAVHRTSILELGTEMYTRTQVEAWAAGCETADYVASIESDRTAVVVAEAREVERAGTDAPSDADGIASCLLAFGSLSLEAPESSEAAVDAEVTGVYVHPSVARSGVGSRVLSALERRARSRGVDTLGLTASLNAVPFYESHGYEPVQERSHEFSPGCETGVEGRVLEMKNSL